MIFVCEPGCTPEHFYCCSTFCYRRHEFKKRVAALWRALWPKLVLAASAAYFAWHLYRWWLVGFRVVAQ